MEKIINGKSYNTETAIKCGSWANSNNFRDFDYVEETLYRKKTGEFFLHGEGGADSKYARVLQQNQWGSGEEIMPLSYKEAQKWAEEKLDGDEYEEIFGEVSEDDGRSTISFSLPTNLILHLRMEASRAGISLSEYAESLFNHALLREN